MDKTKQYTGPWTVELSSYQVADPERYGIVEFADRDTKVVSD